MALEHTGRQGAGVWRGGWAETTAEFGARRMEIRVVLSTFSTNFLKIPANLNYALSLLYPTPSSLKNMVGKG